MHGLVTVGAEHSSSIKRTFDLTGRGDTLYPLVADFSRLSPLLPPQPHSHLRSPLQFDPLFDVRQARPLPQKLCSTDVSLTVLGLYLPNTRIGGRGKAKSFLAKICKIQSYSISLELSVKGFTPMNLGGGFCFSFLYPLQIWG